VVLVWFDAPAVVHHSRCPFFDECIVLPGPSQYITAKDPLKEKPSVEKIIHGLIKEQAQMIYILF
jgi:hypothetical protein